MAGLIMSGREELLKDARATADQLRHEASIERDSYLSTGHNATADLIERLLSVVAEAWDEGYKAHMNFAWDNDDRNSRSRGMAVPANPFRKVVEG